MSQKNRSELRKKDLEHRQKLKEQFRTQRTTPEKEAEKEATKMMIEKVERLRLSIMSNKSSPSEKILFDSDDEEFWEKNKGCLKVF